MFSESDMSMFSQDSSTGKDPPVPAPGKRVRKPVQRRSVDYTSTVVRYMQVRMWQRDVGENTLLQPVPSAALDMLPTLAYLDNAATSFTTKFVHCSTNKVRCSINRVLWTPTGRRLITGSQSGEFTLWNGLSFNFEMILQAHDSAVRSMVWSHNENWMVTGDDGGCIKYWQTNMNNVKANKSAHREPVRDLSFSSTDLKFCSCSDDTTVKVWDFARCQEERSFTGHGWDVKSVDWHPQKSLLVSGAKDNLVKLWDAKSGRELCTLHGHKNTVFCTKWNRNGNWVLTASRDQTIKLYDIRTLKDLETYRGHKKEVTALVWHPFHEELFVSGSYDGSIIHWLVGHELPQAEIPNAHENSIWDLAWHPMGHILCSGGNDHTTKFWCRNRPGDTLRDKYSSVQLQGTFNEQMAAAGTRPSASLQMEGHNGGGSFLGGAPEEGTIPGVGMAMPMMQSAENGAPMGSNRVAGHGGISSAPPPRGPHPPPSAHPHPSPSGIALQHHAFSQHHQLLQMQQQQSQSQELYSQQHLSLPLAFPPPPPPRVGLAPPLAQPPLTVGGLPQGVILSRPSGQVVGLQGGAMMRPAELLGVGLPFRAATPPGHYPQQ